VTATLDAPIQRRDRYPGAVLFTMDPGELQALIDRDFDRLVSLAVADATHKNTPAHVRRMLRAEDMYEDWQDALACAEATLQVAIERLDYDQDPKLARVQKDLRAVRCQFHAAANRANKRRRHDNKQANGQYPEWLRGRYQIALRWLKLLHIQEYIDRADAAYTAAGHGEPLHRPYERGEMFTQAIAEGWISPPYGAQAQALLALPPDDFRRAVIADTRDQNERVDGLYHPLVTDRWLEALAGLMRDVAPLAHASSEHVLGPLKVDLPEFDEADAHQILNARRFFAHLRQRRIECRRWARIWTSDMLAARKADPRVVAYRGAQRQAREALALAYPEEFARILAAVEAVEVGADMDERTYPPIRQRMLKELFPGYGDGASS
jgi:hypothetical protein